MTTFETEVKFYLADLAGMAQNLSDLGAHQSKPRLFERNVRYENGEQSLTSRGLVLRLRQDDRIRLTYKEPAHSNLTSVTRLELETEVGDFAAMDAILAKLGYFPHVSYEKYRTSYEYQGAEIVLDEMPYGNFMEIEADSTLINQLIPLLGLAEQKPILGSYMDLFGLVKSALGLDFHDLTFQNFEGVEVQASLFR